MAIIVTSANTTTPITASTTGNVYLILPNVFVTTSGDAVDGANISTSKSIIVHGGLVSEISAIDLGTGVDGGNNRIHVSPTGSLFGEGNAIDSDGGSLDVLNEGSIFSDNDGLAARGDGNEVINRGSIVGLSDGMDFDGDQLRVTNYGLIQGADEGLELAGTGYVITNFGDIVSTNSSISNEAIQLTTDLGESGTVINYGYIGAIGAIQGNSGDETIINRGNIVGEIELDSGNDRFDGRGGIVDGDVKGGDNDDVYLIDDSDISLIEFASEGTDLVITSVTFALPENFENLSLAGGDDIDGFGNDLNNFISASAGANFIDGGDGIDTVTYGAAQVGVVAQLFGAVNSAVVNPGTLGSVTLPIARSAGTGGAEGDILLNVENLFGSASDDILLGSGSANVLRGLAGDDTLFGNAGDDVLEGGVGADRMDGGAGTDFAAYSTAGSGVVADMIVLAGNTGDAAGDIFGNIQNLRGSMFNDTLKGTFASNRLEGLGGNDVLQGRGGNDTYLGGAGNDTFVFQNGFGTEIVLDFDALNGNEKVDLVNVTAITDFTDLFNNHLSISGGGSVITAGAGTITLLGVAVSDLDANDFIF